MKSYTSILVLYLFITISLSNSSILNSVCGNDNFIVDDVQDDHWQGRITVDVPENTNGWVVNIQFDSTVDIIDCVLADVTGSGRQWSLSSKDWDDDLSAGSQFEIGIIVYFSTNNSPSIISIDFNDQNLCQEEGVATTDSGAASCSNSYSVDDQQDDHWQGRVTLTVPENTNGWIVNLKFDSPVDSIDCALATVTGSGVMWTLSSRDYDDELEAGTVLEIGIIVHFSNSDSSSIVSVNFNGDSLCDSDEGSTTSSTSGNDCSNNYVIDTQAEDHWQGRVTLTVPETTNGWIVKLQFDSTVDSIDCALATVTGSGSMWTLSSRDFDDELGAGTDLDIGIIVHFSNNKVPSIISITFNDDNLCESDGGSTTSSGSVDDCIDNYSIDTQTDTQWQGVIVVNVPENVNGWELKVQFWTPIDSIDCALATVTGSGSLWTLTSRDFDDEIQAGIELDIGIIVHFSGDLPFINSLIFNEMMVCTAGS